MLVGYLTGTAMRLLKTILFASIIMLTTGGVANASLFKDVPTDSWVYKAIVDLDKAGLVEGYPDFPGRTYTRYEAGMVTTRIFSKLEREGCGDKLTFEQTLELLGLTETFDDVLVELGANLKEPMTKLADENIFEPAIGNHPRIKPPRAAVFEDVPYPHWSYQALYELKRAVGFEVYPDFTPPGPLTRYEMAMNIISIYGELSEPAVRDGFSLEDTRKLFALTVDFAPEFGFLVNLGKDSIRIRETVIWLANNGALRKESVAQPDKPSGHGHYKDVPKDSWAYRAVASFVASGILEGYTDGHGGSAERTFTRYEYAMVVARLHGKLDEGYYANLTDAEILRLLALSAEFAPEMDMLGFDCGPAMLALLSGQLFQAEQNN
jgi:hypothetical protein